VSQTAHLVGQPTANRPLFGLWGFGARKADKSSSSKMVYTRPSHLDESVSVGFGLRNFTKNVLSCVFSSRAMKTKDRCTGIGTEPVRTGQHFSLFSWTRGDRARTRTSACNRMVNARITGRTGNAQDCHDQRRRPRTRMELKE
jgi:hypothetical protein